MSSSSTKRAWTQSFPYQVDYNDHFETPLRAYQDIKPFVDLIFRQRIASGGVTISKTADSDGDSHATTEAASSSPEQPIVYDPYYCNGQSAKLLRQVGFQNVVHEKRDFYQDISHKTVPDYDVLITNPPYSDQHKERCLKYCFKQLKHHNKPFLVLLPAYVAARHYYKALLEQYEDSVKMVYLMPRNNDIGDYEYSHPEGTGHETSPFASLWFCGIGRAAIATLGDDYEALLSKASLQAKQLLLPTLATSLAELEQAGVITTTKRPNPKQRRKKRKHAAATAIIEGGIVTTVSMAKSVSSTATSLSKQPSDGKAKWRDEHGKRTRNRF